MKTGSVKQGPPKFKYVTSYVLGEGVEDACTIDSMVKPGGGEPRCHVDACNEREI